MKKMMILMLAFSLQLLAGSSFPYDDLEEVLPFNGHGWYLNGDALEKIIKERNVTTVVELGSWLGKSTIHMASILPEGGKVYAVDHWLGGADHQPGVVGYEEWADFLPVLYEQFLSNVIHAQMTDRIIPIRTTTLLASIQIRELGVKPDLVYVDASHDMESVYKDLVAYYPFVKGHGILCGDDWGWGVDLPVMRAVQRFASENNLRIEVPNGWLWVLYEN